MKKFIISLLSGIGGLFILLVIIGTVIPSDSGDQQADAKNESQDGEQETLDKQDKKKENKNKTAKIGDTVKVGNFSFKVNEVSRTNEITTANDYMVYEPDSKNSEFFLVNMTVKNVGDEAATTDSSFFKLVKGDVTYSPSTILVSDKKFFTYETINPGLEQTGNVLFEIPKTQKGFTLKVSEGMWETNTSEIILK